MSISPKPLSKEDKVAIIATARKITLKEVLPSVQLFASWGLNVVIGQTIGKSYNQFAGNDKERAEELQSMLDDKDIKAIFCARGGYGTTRLLDSLNFDKFIKNPKWLIGYSDITSLLSHLYYKYNIESIHGIMPVNIENRTSNIATDSLKEVLFDGKNTILAPYHTLNKEGEATGELVGGNLSVLYSLLGSESFSDTKDKILFIEDLDEYLYHIDRMMLGLKRAGKLKNIKALLVGSFKDMHDNSIPFGASAYEIIANISKDLNIPIAFNVPCGHIGTENHAFIHGRQTKVVVSATETKIVQ